MIIKKLAAAVIAAAVMSMFAGCVDGGHVGGGTTGDNINHPPAEATDGGDATADVQVPDNGNGGNLNGSGHLKINMENTRCFSGIGRGAACFLSAERRSETMLSDA